jgi:hypothetical protein
MRSPRFSDSLWGVRLQTLWIFFAVLYSAAGSLAPRRVVSSWMILLAGVLLLAVFAHVIVSADLDRIRRLLLVTLGASLLVVSIAVHSFRDYIAGAFAGLFALMLGVLLWRSRIDEPFRRLQYTCFASMSLAVVAAACGLLATLGLKESILLGWVSPEFYVYAPMQTATMCGFSVGALLGGRILSNRITGYISLPPAKMRIVFLQACLMSIISGVVISFANRARVVRWIGGVTRGSVFAACYSLCFILPIALYLAILHKKSRDRPLFSMRHSSFLVLIAVCGSVPADMVVSLAGHSGTFVRRWISAEGPTGFVVGLGIGAGFFCVNRLSNTIMAVRPKGNANLEA